MNLQLNNKKNNPYRKDPSSVTNSFKELKENPLVKEFALAAKGKFFSMQIEIPTLRK